MNPLLRQILVVGFMGLCFLYSMFILLAYIKAENAWWDLFGETWKKGADQAAESVYYWANGMPKNAQACRRSAETNMAAAEHMMRDRQSKHR